MGQAVLSERVTPYKDDGVVYIICGLPSGAKGNRVNIPDPDTEIVPLPQFALVSSGTSAVTQTNSETSAGVPGRVLSSL